MTESRLVAWGLHKGLAKPNKLMKPFESTYALLVRSEEKGRTRLETLVYALFILSAIFSIWQFAHQTNTLPLRSINTSSAVVCEAPAVCG